MSQNPHLFAAYFPEADGRFAVPPTHIRSDNSAFPQKKAVADPARQAYSHSASLGKRKPFVPKSPFSFSMNCRQSSRETDSTGAVSGLSDLNREGFSLMTAAQSA